MSTKNRVGMLLAAAVVCLVLTAKTPAWDGENLASGVWVGTWTNSLGQSSRSSVIDFDQCCWYDLDGNGEISGKLDIDRLHYDELAQTADWNHYDVGPEHHTYLVNATWDTSGKNFKLEYWVFDATNNTKLAIYSGTGRFRTR